MTNWYVPGADGVPESTPSEDSVIPTGSDPDVTWNVGVGYPANGNVKLPGVPSVNDVLVEPVTVGGSATTTVNCSCVAPAEFVAVTTTG